MSVRKLSDQKGVSMILLSVLVLSAMTVIALSVSDIVRNGILMGRTQVESTKAFFAAEAGAERILWEVWQYGLEPGALCSSGDYFCFDNTSYDILSCDPSPPCPGGQTDDRLLTNGAHYSVIYDFANPTTTMTSIGSYGGVSSRVIQLLY